MGANEVASGAVNGVSADQVIAQKGHFASLTALESMQVGLGSFPGAFDGKCTVKCTGEASTFAGGRTDSIAPRKVGEYALGSGVASATIVVEEGNDNLFAQGRFSVTEVTATSIRRPQHQLRWSQLTRRRVSGDHLPVAR